VGSVSELDSDRARQIKMLRIQRSVVGEIVFVLSGIMGNENIAELEKLIGSEAKPRLINLDLKQLTLAARDAISFLERCEADGVELINCAGCIRELITTRRNEP
jgi:hypothetical protein